METFGELLKTYIQSQRLTAYGIAKDTGIDRSFLQGVFKGSKKMPEKRFSDIVNQQFFTAEQVSNLCSLYYAEKMGKNEMKRIQFIEKWMCGGLREALLEDREYPITKITPCRAYCGRENVLSLIYTALNEAPVKHFVSNFVFSDEEINSIVYNVCLKKGVGTFFHYISRNDDNTLLDLEDVFYSIHYAEIGYLTDMHYAPQSTDMLPLFILTERYFIKYDADAENAYVIETKTISDFAEDKVKAIRRKCRRCIYLPENAVEMMKLIDLSISENTDGDTIGMDNSVCPVHLTPEIASDNVTDFVKQRPELIAGLFAHYKMMLGSREVENDEGSMIKIIVMHSAIDAFVNNGRVTTLPLSLASPVKKNEHRAYMIRQMYSLPHNEYKLTNPMFFKTNYPFAWQIKQKTLSICAAGYPTDFNSPEQYIGNVFYMTENEKTVATFANFFEYFSKTEKVHSLSASTQLLTAYADALRGNKTV